MTFGFYILIKNLINTVMGILILTNLKNKNYNYIFVISNLLTKIIYHKPIKININNFCLIKVIINMIMRYYSFSNFIINNQDFVFTLKFLFSLYYF